MPAKFKPQIVTANDLLEGDVVYWTREHNWTREHSKAWVSASLEDAAQMLELANKDQHLVVGPYLADVELDAEGIPQPAHFREAFRTRGPSNYYHGKQAD